MRALKTHRDEDLLRVINGRIGFGNPTDGNDNIDCRWATGTTPAGADTEFAVVHNLGRVPVGYFLVAKDKAGDVYTSTGGTAWTTTQMYLKCTVVSLTYSLIVF